MKLRPLLLVFGVALGSGAHAQSTEDLKRQLDQSNKTIKDLQDRVQALEAQKPPPRAPTATGAIVIAPDSRGEEGVPDADKARLEISGKVHLDAIYDFNRLDPEWNATLRPSKIPVNCPGASGQYDPGCGKDGETIFSLKQTAFSFKGFIPTSVGALKTELSFDLFGNGGGGTSQFRLLNAWGELGSFAAGQYFSLFMNIDVFPNVLDYWGPNGMVFLRNPQIRYTPVDRDGLKVAFSLEAPFSAVDTGKLPFATPGLDIQGRSRWPDVVGRVSKDGDWGQVYVAGIVRSIGYETRNTPNNEPSGFRTGYGINVNGWYKMGGKNRIVGHLVYGTGIASYMNDGGVDLAPDANLRAEPVPSLGVYVYYDHYWSERYSSSIGASTHRQDTTDGELGNAFRQGSYASANLLWYPAKNVTTGVELLWGRLVLKDGASNDDTRVQFSAIFRF